MTLCLVSVSYVFAQIGELAPKEKTIEIKRALKNVSLVRDKTDNTYCLMVESDNQYEEKYVLLLLGTGEKESLTSLVNLYHAIQTPDQTFEVQGYNIATFDAAHKHYALIGKSGPIEFAAGSYMLEEEALSNAIIFLIDRIDDFDFSDAIVKTKKVWGSAKSSTGITGLTCDFYLPQLDVHFVGGPDKYERQTDSKKYTKLVSGLTDIDVPWGKEQYKIVVNGLDNNLIKMHRPFFEKIWRVKEIEIGRASRRERV